MKVMTKSSSSHVDQIVFCVGVESETQKLQDQLEVAMAAGYQCRIYECGGPSLLHQISSARDPVHVLPSSSCTSSADTSPEIDDSR